MSSSSDGDLSFLEPARPGSGTREYVALPDVNDPTILVDLSSRRRAAVAVMSRSDARGPRDVLAVSWLAARLLFGGPVDATKVISFAGGDDGAPAVLEPLEGLGLARPEWWYASLTRGSSRRRIVLVVRLRGGRRVVVKLARERGQRAKFDREGVGLARAAQAPAVVADRAPKQLARFEVDGRAASVQTASPGIALAQVLRGSLPRRAKVQALDRVASWTIDIATATRSASGIFVHGDLADGNVLMSLRSFEIVDWERARHDGMPLWDLLYFAANAAPLLDAVEGLDRTLDHLLAIFRGEVPGTSPLVLGWVRRYVGALGIEPGHVGRLALSCWQHHAANDDLEPDEAAAERAAWPLMERLAEAWAVDDELGTGWSCWS